MYFAQAALKSLEDDLAAMAERRDEVRDALLSRKYQVGLRGCSSAVVRVSRG